MLPPALRAGDHRAFLLRWLGLGLAVRFALMPFAVSADMLAVWWRAHLIAYDGALFGDYLVNMGAHYVHALFLLLLAPVLPPPDALWTDPWWWSDTLALAPQVQREFVLAPGALPTLFWLKVPYLLFDLAAGVLALWTVAGRGLADDAAPGLRRAWIFWMLSPAGLYAGFLFGRYEMFAVALVVAALLACERERPWLGAVLLGVAITMRTYPLLLVPLFSVVVRGRWRARAGWAGVAVAPFAVELLSNRLLAGAFGGPANLQGLSTSTTLFDVAVPVDGTGDLPLFVVFAVTLVVVAVGWRDGWWTRPAAADAAATAGLWVWVGLFHLGLFALTTFSAHWFAWVTPFVALALARRPSWRGVLPLHLAQVSLVLAFADLVGGPGTTWGLLQPLQPDLVDALPNLREALLTRPELAEQLAGVLRGTFVAVTALLGVYFARDLSGPRGLLPLRPPPGGAGPPGPPGGATPKALRPGASVGTPTRGPATPPAAAATAS